MEPELEASEGLKGYRGRVLKILRDAGISVGDIVKITRGDTEYEGYLMPRSESGDDLHIVIKLGSGYNIGVKVTSASRVERLGAGAKPSYTRSTQQPTRRGLRRVDIISTGGTIASRVDYRTGAVHPALTAADLYSAVPELSDLADVEAHILYGELSENITPEHWVGIAQKIAEVVKSGTDGVVVCHGTDTMAYTSAALSFALRNLPIPVIVVGSQRSSDRPSSDAATNLLAAVAVASSAPFAEVAVAMHGTSSDKTVSIHRGTKVRKCHTSGRYAFRSINSQPLAVFNLEQTDLKMLLSDYVRRNAERSLELKASFNQKVLLVKFYPGMAPHALDWAIERGYSGLVIEGTGLGHVSRYLQDSVRKAVEAGMLVGMASQCLWGRVNMNVYTTGRDLLGLGVVPLEDMLPETALVKMMWVLAQTSDLEEAKRLLLTDIAGEISERTLLDDQTW
ncbi:MAG: Glu-tRNA(Gln) amidotransferase subunit GatD [Candidatus Bathyarchaeia archaeon]